MTAMCVNASRMPVHTRAVFFCSFFPIYPYSTKTTEYNFNPSLHKHNYCNHFVLIVFSSCIVVYGYAILIRLSLRIFYQRN